MINASLERASAATVAGQQSNTAAATVIARRNITNAAEDADEEDARRPCRVRQWWKDVDELAAMIRRAASFMM